MKQHSYAFYNGHLSGVYKRRALLQRKLKQLEAIEPVKSPTSPSGGPRSPQFASTGTDLQLTKPANRRPSASVRSSTNLNAEQSEVAAVASSLASNQPITADQMTTFSTVIKHEIDELTKELHGKSENGRNAYPRNLTFNNMADWSCLPTLVYELEYPRQEEINWAYVAEKTAATFGVL
jgi:sterol O-acyltransferase